MQHRKKYRTGYYCSGRRIFGDIVYLWRLEQWQDGDDDASRAGDALVSDDYFRAVEHHDNNAVALLYAQRLQTRCQLGCFPGDIEVGVLTYILLIFVDHRLVGAETNTVVDGQVGSYVQVSII